MSPGIYSLNLSGGSGGGSGTVTSVSFTGGLVSVANPTTTPAFTVAGTSGGIPYFSSASTWASSAALTANALIKGGGAGVAPSSVTTGTGVLTALGVNIGSAGAFVVFNGAGGTPSSLTLTSATGLVATTGLTATGTKNSTTFLRGDDTWAVPSGSGTVTVVGAGSLTSTALVTGGGTTTLQTPSATATLDSSGNISTPGTVTVGSGATTAGAFALTQGTTQSTGTTNITVQAPTSVTSYIITMPGTVGSTGLVQWTVSGSVATLSSVTTLPSGITLVAPVLGTPSSGNLGSCTVDGTNLVGFRGIPQNSQSTAYTTVLADAGKHILHPTADNNARTFTIDSNANVAYVIGTVITFINQINTVTIAITSDTMTLFAGSGTGTTGSRTLAAGGTATAVKVASTAWIISGIGLT